MFRKRVLRSGAVALVVASIAAVSTTGVAQGQSSVRGFDGSTITVAGLGISGQFNPDMTTGAAARIKRFNDTNEIKGIKINFAEFADDKADPATALNESRRLVDQVGVFAIVPAGSTNLPVSYLESKQVPVFGLGIDPMFCTSTPSTKVWAFGWSGCAVPPDAKRVADTTGKSYAYVSKTTGKKHPTVAMFSSDQAAGIIAAKNGAASATGAGFKVVYAKGEIPLQVGDYTPYVQKLLTSDDGHQPDAISCLGSTVCIAMYSALKAAGFTGFYQSALYSNLLLKPFEGAYAAWQAQSFEATGVPALEQMKADIDAVKPGKLSTPMAMGYFSVDQFIAALKSVVKGKGTKGITPQAVRTAASTMTWELKNLAGPAKYPASTVRSTPACGTLNASDGTIWSIVEPYKCSYKTYPVLPQFPGN